jgi:hypothetical protein
MIKNDFFEFFLIVCSDFRRFLFQIEEITCFFVCIKDVTG